MEGYFDEKGHIKIKVIVAGKHRALKIDALFDTGCSGYLVLPISIAVPLGLELIGVESVQYADGRISEQLVFNVIIKTNGKLRTVPTILTSNSEALAGIKMCDNHQFEINFKNKKVKISETK